MTKTSTPSKLFVHKVLLSLQFLQGLDKNKCGATARRVTSYVKKNFPNDGDIASQVQASLDECVHYGFVEKQKNKYILVGPIANIQMQPHNSLSREREVNRVRKIFPHEWRRPPRKRYSRRRRGSNKPGIFSSLFQLVKNIFFGKPICEKRYSMRTYPRRYLNLEYMRKKMKKRAHCSRNGCIAPCQPGLEINLDDVAKEREACDNLKRKRNRLRREVKKLMKKYKKKCDLDVCKKKTKRKRKKNNLPSSYVECTPDETCNNLC